MVGLLALFMYSKHMHSSGSTSAIGPRKLRTTGPLGALVGPRMLPGYLWGPLPSRVDLLRESTVLCGLLEPRFRVDVSDPDALGAFCQSKHPGPGALYFAPQGRKPGTKLPCKRKVKTAQKFHRLHTLYSSFGLSVIHICRLL